MLTKFTIETSCENNSESQKLYVVMEVDSSWHLYPEYALIGIYTSKEVAIKVAREQVESIEKQTGGLSKMTCLTVMTTKTQQSTLTKSK